jgi:hypothetical protein
MMQDMLRFVLFFVFAFALCSCCKPNSAAYKKLYAHLENPSYSPQANWNSDYYLVIYVNARHLDYTNNYSFLNTVAKHPSDGSRNRDVGHVWIYLQGVCDGEILYFCGGHSGERGLCQAKYFDGIMNLMDFGYANPTKEQLNFPRYEPNPVKYFWETQKDGYLEWGSGGHRPTFAAKVDLTAQQFQRIVDFVGKYDFKSYSLVGNQCSSFAAQVASLAGLDLDCEITIVLDKDLYLAGQRIRFWEDPSYSQLTISSPDIIERSLMRAVQEGRAEYVP